MVELQSIEEIISLVMSKPTREEIAPLGVNITYRDNLALLNYNHIAEANRGEWTFFQRVSRGLIIDTEWGNVVARPFDKFFNYGQNGMYPSPDATLVGCYEKLDGSLGILYRHDGVMKVATRGSFDGEQAKMATQMLHEKYCTPERKWLVGLPYNYTLLFEIIYPQNRVVLNYGDREELALLAIRNFETGEYLPQSEVFAIARMYGFALPKMYKFNNSEELTMITSAPEFQGEEGIVALYSDGSRFKFKTDTYKHLHRYVSGVTLKSVMTAIIENRLPEFIQSIPDEFPEIRGQALEYVNFVEMEYRQAYYRITSIVDEFEVSVRGANLDGKEMKKALALFMKERQIERHIQSFCFQYITDKDEAALCKSYTLWMSRQ